MRVELIALCTLPLVVGLSACAGESSRRRPNVVLISLDSVRADHLSCYGYSRPTSPHLDRLAAEGTLFTRAYSASSWTVPSHMTMLTSLWPSLHGVDTWKKHLDPARVTLAERFRDAGYDTAAFVSGPSLHAAFGFDQGFRLYNNTMAFSPEDFQAGDPTLPSTIAHARSHQLVTGPRVSELVRRWLDQEATRPFFLFVHLWDPHYDYIPPPPYDKMFDSGYRGTFDFSHLDSNRDIRADMPLRDEEHLVALYDGEIAATDGVIGELIESLERHRLLDGTLVVITADHGEEFFEHGGKAHFRTLFDEVIHVPLIFRLPGRVRAGQRTEVIFDAVHLMPTILGIAGITAGPEARGRDLEGILRGEPPPDDLWAFSELTVVPPLTLYAIRTGGRKYLAGETGVSALINLAAVNDTPVPDAPDPLTLPVIYYDLATDPGEKEPRQVDDPAAMTFADRFRRIISDLKRSADGLPREGGLPATLDVETERQLRALGYVP
jgi:arylsulfatase A-like enzyme